MKYFLITLAMIGLVMNPISFDFGESCSNCQEWYVVLDGVMGGLSKGEKTQTENSVIFKGKVSLENNGGFASMRTPYKEYDLSDYKKVVIRYRSSGQDFALTLNKYRSFWRPQYKTNLPSTQGEWNVVTCNLEDFDTYRLNEKLNTSPSKKDLANIIRLGLISNTKAATDFEIEVDYINFQ